MEIYREIGKVLERVSPSKERAPRGGKSPPVEKKKSFSLELEFGKFANICFWGFVNCGNVHLP
jgi:hypothetical protein